jgi:hypothetical protein
MSASFVPGELAPALDSLASEAARLAAPIAAAAARSTTLGRERAVLRLLGVGGLDREGRPLAAEVVDRYVGGSRERLAGGIGLPFALALLEYDATPQVLALDIAAGTIDLAAEAKLLADPERRSSAVAHLEQLAVAAVDRIDANRIARRELLAMLGDRPVPWIGATLREGDMEPALREVAVLVHAGADLVSVAVPAGRELALRLGELGQDVTWRPGSADTDGEPTPSGSQRGLARLRDVLDRAAVERGAYVRLSMVPTPLATPEGAIVAAFERADGLELDPMAEIVVTGVDPDRAIADFVFAARVARRAGATVLVGAGPLVVAPDLDAGVNSDPATRSGRALALQLLTVEIARRAGLQPHLIIANALPGWIAGEPEPAARALAEVALRRALLSDLALAFVEPAGDEPSTWPALAAAVQPGDQIGLVLRRPAPGSVGAADMILQARAAGDAARGLEVSLGPRDLRGTARDHLVATIVAAERLFELFARDGWSAITGPTTGLGWGRLGGESVAPADETAGPVERALS